MAGDARFRTRVSRDRRSKGKFVARIWWDNGRMDQGGPFDTEREARDWVQTVLDSGLARGDW